MRAVARRRVIRPMRAGALAADAEPAVLPEEHMVIPAIAEDGTLYPIGKLDAHRRGVRHLAVSVFIFDGERMLIQQRAADKYHCGGLWANSCCTHPHWDEDPADCARRRVGEELGLDLPVEACSVVDYEAPVGNALTENEHVTIFRANGSAGLALDRFDPSEVQAVRWVREQDLAREVAADPERFTPWLRIYLQRWNELALRRAA